ncbi:MAG: hypothetical protein WBF73_06815 [Bradyrhizobium sp.]
MRHAAKFDGVAGLSSTEEELLAWVADRWELVDVRSKLHDYGISIWKNRLLETGFVNSIIKMNNRTRGEYKDSCFIFGFVLDSEFEVARDPVGVDCKDSNGIARYKKSKEFSSRWIAN